MIGVRDEHATRFGRQVLTLWSGPFASVYVGEAVELPRHDGYMVNVRGRRIRVTCASPRDDANFLAVDAAIQSAVTE